MGEKEQQITFACFSRSWIDAFFRIATIKTIKINAKGTTFVVELTRIEVSKRWIYTWWIKKEKNCIRITRNGIVRKRKKKKDIQFTEGVWEGKKPRFCLQWHVSSHPNPPSHSSPRSNSPFPHANLFHSRKRFSSQNELTIVSFLDNAIWKMNWAIVKEIPVMQLFEGGLVDVKPGAQVQLGRQR